MCNIYRFTGLFTWKVLYKKDIRYTVAIHTVKAEHKLKHLDTIKTQETHLKKKMHTFPFFKYSIFQIIG